MVWIIETAWVFEMRVVTVKLGCLFIHKLCEFLYTSAAMFGQSIGGFVGGLKKHGIEGILYGNCITC